MGSSQCMRMESVSHIIPSTCQLHTFHPKQSRSLPSMGPSVGVEAREQPGQFQQHGDSTAIGVSPVGQPLQEEVTQSDKPTLTQVPEQLQDSTALCSTCICPTALRPREDTWAGKKHRNRELQEEKILTGATPKES